MKKFTLTIDTSQIKEVTVVLEGDGLKKEKTYASTVHTSQQVLPLIEALSSQIGISVQDIASIRLHTGPGSFTGLRVGASIANALGFLLDIPVNGKKQPVTDLKYGNDQWS